MIHHVALNGPAAGLSKRSPVNTSQPNGRKRDQNNHRRATIKNFGFFFPFTVYSSAGYDHTSEVLSETIVIYKSCLVCIRTRLFLKMFPLTFIYMSWYMCLSIFLDSLYFLRRRLKTLVLLIHNTFVGSLVPFLLL